LVVQFSGLAKRKLELLSVYLVIEWGEESADKFFNTFDEKVNQVESFPKSCKNFINSKIKICIVSSQTSFLYQLNNNKIEIITVFDNRQNPTLIYNDLLDYFS